MRRAEKMSGLKAVSLEPAPDMSMNPSNTTAIPMASRIKFVRVNARFFLSMFI